MKRAALGIISFAICAAALLSPESARAAASEGIRYVALGDSIAAGYALPGYTGSGSTPDSGFVSILARSLGDDDHLIDLTESGLDTGELLSLLQTEKCRSALFNSGLITVTVGSNNLLGPCVQLLLKSVGLSEGSSETVISLLRDDPSLIVSFTRAMMGVEARMAMKKGADRFKSDWPLIAAALREIAPHAVVLVTSLYNPYRDFTISAMGMTIRAGDLLGPYLEEMNDFLQSCEYGSDYYTVIDITGAQIAATMSGPAGVDVNPHPSVEGHRQIAEALLAALDIMRPHVNPAFPPRRKAGMAPRPGLGISPCPAHRVGAALLL